MRGEEGGGMKRGEEGGSCSHVTGFCVSRLAPTTSN